MRKQRVLVTVLSAAAILSAGQAFTSMAAARGWVRINPALRTTIIAYQFNLSFKICYYI